MLVPASNSPKPQPRSRSLTTAVALSVQSPLEIIILPLLLIAAVIRGLTAPGHCPKINLDLNYIRLPYLLTMQHLEAPILRSYRRCRQIYQGCMKIQLLFQGRQLDRSQECLRKLLENISYCTINKLAGAVGKYCA
jgi:hypothetical protein